MRPGRARLLLGAAAAIALTGCPDVTVTRWEGGEAACGEAAVSPAWTHTTPEEAGLDALALEALVERIEAGALGNLHALLVVRDGRLAFERYFTGRDASWGRPLGSVAFGPETLHDLRSVTKSVVGALVGIAHGDGSLPDLDAPVAGFFPNLAPGSLAELAGVTLRHALSMTAGLAWDESSHPYWDPRNDETAMWLHRDPVAYVLGRPRLFAPGERFAYNGGLPTVLAAVIEKATGTSLERFASQRLWCPLGVGPVEWMRHGSGLPIAASGLRLRPRDMARFGWMMLEKGRFGGRQVVPGAYAKSSLTAQVDTGGSLRESYGYQWWVSRIEEPTGAIGLPLAIGNGGQRIVVHDEARMVVVVTAGSYDAPDQDDGPARAIEAVLGARRR